ncbi:MAG: thiamine phosphate synthase [Proteobacteria bacterium]|nr:thiamine phosphate synthase [Pseudomonadota bacterium]
MKKLPSPLLFIADMDAAGECLFPILQTALKGGCRWVLLRGVNASRQQLLAAGLRARKLCKTHKAKLFISRDAVVARRIKADGLHLSSRQKAKKIPGMMLGQSCHNAAEMRRALANGVDYIFLSPVFKPLSKKSRGAPLGLAKLKALIKKSPVPVCALGGITPEKAGLCLQAGAQAVAVLGGIINASDPQTQIQNYLKQLQKPRAR